MISRKIGLATSIREDSDYDDDYVPNSETTDNQINTAKEIVELVEKYLKD